MKRYINIFNWYYYFTAKIFCVLHGNIFLMSKKRDQNVSFISCRLDPIHLRNIKKWQEKYVQEFKRLNELQ